MTLRRAMRGGRRSWGDAIAVAALLLSGSRSARSDPGEPAAGAELWSQWSFDPGLIVALAISLVLTIHGLRRLQRRTRRSRGSAAIPRGAQARALGSVPALAYALAYALGVTFVLLAIASPIDALSGALASAHMVQHLLLVACAAPVLAWSRPFLVALHGLPVPLRDATQRLAGIRAVRRTLRALRSPLGALLAHTAALWVWHVPGLYEAALAHPVVHWVEHLSFLGTALLYWGAVWHGAREGGTVLLLLFAGATQGVLLGALLTVAPTAWYRLPNPAAYGFSISPLDDQRLAGLLMWVPGAAVYLGVALFVGASWMDRAQRAVLRRERWRRSTVEEQNALEQQSALEE